MSVQLAQISLDHLLQTNHQFCHQFVWIELDCSNWHGEESSQSAMYVILTLEWWQCLNWTKESFMSFEVKFFMYSSISRKCFLSYSSTQELTVQWQPCLQMQPTKKHLTRMEGKKKIHPSVVDAIAKSPIMFMGCKLHILGNCFYCSLIFFFLPPFCSCGWPEWYKGNFSHQNLNTF